MPEMIRSFLNQAFFKDALSGLSGILLVLAFAPFHYFYLAVVSPALLLWACLNTSRSRALWRGLLFGIGLFSVGVSWVFISIHTYGHTSVFTASVITVLFIITLALPFALQTYIFQFFSPQKAITLFFIFPLLWVLEEMLRSSLFTGFPWLLIGYSQIHSALRGWAPVGSIYLVSFLTSLTASLVVYSFLFPKKKIYPLAIILLIWGGGWLLSRTAWTQVIGKPLRVALLQGNIPQNLKWENSEAQKILSVYEYLMETYGQSDLIILPEAAIPYLADQIPIYLDRLEAKAKQNKQALIIGIPIRQNKNIYNAMIGLGEAQGLYIKRHLVPFGEYVPFEKQLRGLINFFDLPMSSFSAGHPTQAGIQLFHFNTANAICYEIAYLHPFLSAFPAAKIIITLANDAWFGNSLALAQQLEIAQMRSLETGRYQLIATNNGLTAMVNPQGEIINQLQPFKMDALIGKVYLMEGHTPMMKLYKKFSNGL